MSIDAVHFASDGTVTLDLTDKRELKLTAVAWANLGSPRDSPLTVNQLENLELEARYTKIRKKMLDFLATREHSAAELRKKLKQRFYKLAMSDFSTLVERCLMEMQENDFQSDERFTRRFIESKLSNKPHGPFKILQDLKILGISNEMAQTVLNELSNHDIWLKKAIECLKRIKKNNKKQTDENLSQKLYQRGFSRETIEQVLKEFQNNAENADFRILDSVQEVK